MFYFIKCERNAKDDVAKFKIDVNTSNFLMGTSLPIRKKMTTKPTKTDILESAAFFQSRVIPKASFNPKSNAQAKKMAEAPREMLEDS